MNRSDFQQLAEDRILDAQALLAAQRWSAAYYLTGYAVECALKACIAKQTSQYDFPDKAFVQKCYTHKIDQLIQAAGLNVVVDAEIAADPSFDSNLRVVKDWNEDSRYEQLTQTEAERLFSAVTDITQGVLRCIKNHW